MIANSHRYLRTPLSRIGHIVVAAAVLVGFSSAPLAAQSPSEMSPIVTVAIAGHEEIFSDIDFLGSLSGNPHMGQQMQGMVGLFTGNQGLAGFDGEKPWGVIVQTDGNQFAGTACLPVTNLESVLAVLQMFEIDVQERADGTYEVTNDNQTFFFRHANNWAFVGLDQERLADAPSDPGKVFGALTKEYDISVQALIKNIPAPIREMAVSQIQAGMQMGMQQLPDEDAGAFELRKQVAQAQMEGLLRSLDEMDELKIGVAIASEESRIFLDFLTTARPGTKLAAQMDQYGDTRTNFAGFYQPDAAFMLTSSGVYSEEDVAMMKEMLGPIQKQLANRIDDWDEISNPSAKDALKSALDDFLAVAKATLENGKSDGGAVLILEPDALAFVLGSLVAETDRVEQGLKKLGQVLEDEAGVGGIRWNADQHANVTFHTFSVPLPPDEREQAEQLLGDKLELAVGIGKNEIFVGAGRDCLARMKEVIDASRSNPGKAVPPMEMSIGLAKIMDTVAAFDDQPVLGMISDMLRTEAQGKDHIRVVAEPVTRGFRVRIELEDGVLRAIGKAAQQARSGAVGAGL